MFTHLVYTGKSGSTIWGSLRNTIKKSKVYQIEPINLNLSSVHSIDVNNWHTRHDFINNCDVQHKKCNADHKVIFRNLQIIFHCISRNQDMHKLFCLEWELRSSGTCWAFSLFSTRRNSIIIWILGSIWQLPISFSTVHSRSTIAIVSMVRIILFLKGWKRNTCFLIMNLIKLRLWCRWLVSFSSREVLELA